jgi:tRNA nucleotidyltransferase/poly(A) polymerase
VQEILLRLRNGGHEAYIVGGAVRDLFLNRPLRDWDVTTSASVYEMADLFKDLRFFLLKGDTLTLVHEKYRFEVTPFRGEGHGRRSLEEDLSHRDFTIDAMAYDEEKGNVLDPFGGRIDLEKKRVKAVGVPDARFLEDPLRLLRGIRIATELGFAVESETLKSIGQMANRIEGSAHERIREELSKILISRKPSSGFHLMRKTGLLKIVLPELLEGYGRRQNGYHRYTVYKHTLLTVDLIQNDPVLRWAALLHDIAKVRVGVKVDGRCRFWGHEQASARLAEEILIRLKISGAMASRITHLITHHMIRYRREWTDATVRRWLHRIGDTFLNDLLALRGADILAHGIDRDGEILLLELANRAAKVMAQSPPLRRADLALDGNQVMKTLELKPGPKVGEVLKTLLEKVIEDPALNSKDALLALLEKEQEKAL